MKMYNPPHPGTILKELYLQPLGLTVTETAKGLGIARKTLTALLQGHSGLSAEMALRLAAAFDTTPEHWLNLQQQYILWQAEKRVDVSKMKHFYQNETLLQ